MTSPTLGLVILLQLTTTTLDDALRSLENGRVPAVVPKHVGREAASRIQPDVEDPQLVHRLARVARQGKAQRELADALLRVATAPGGAPCASAALTELASVPPAELDRVAATLSSETVHELLGSIAELDDGPAAGCIVLLARAAEPFALAELLAEWTAAPKHHPRATRLLEHLARHRAPAECVQALASLDVELPPELWGPAGESLKALVGREPAAADVALQCAGSGEWGPGGAVVRSLGGVWLDDEARWTAAASALTPILHEASDDPGGVRPELIAAAIAAAGDLLLPGIVPLVDWFALHGPSTAVRVAAVRTTAQVGYGDAATIDLLIRLMTDQDALVASAAYAALQRKSGQRAIPMRAEMWHAWRATVELPREAPTPADERLAAERLLRGASERRQRERARPR